MNLLLDPIFRVETTLGIRKMNLPQLLEALGEDSVESLVGIQRHQEDGFHVFLCYLASAILARRGDTTSTQTAEYWLDGLRGLSGEHADDAWTLVVEDLSRPAFLQPPIPQSDQPQLRPKAETPDEMDLLVTAKDHDVKLRRASQPHLDNWVYALVNLQTMSGFLGRGQMGIARMNGGFGNRLIVEVVRSFRPGARWKDAIERLLVYRQNLLTAEYGYRGDGLMLVWLASWDGKTSLRLSQLDPFFIEVCRRVRLRKNPNDTLRVDGLPTTVTRLDAKLLLGAVGDAWLPVDLSKDRKALTVSARGLTPDVMRRMIFSDKLMLSPLQRPRASWRDTCWLTASVLVRGQGKTEGFYEERIPIPPAAQARVFGRSEERDALADLAKRGIDFAGKMRNPVLKMAVFSYLQGGPDHLRLDRDSIEGWWTRVSQHFEARWAHDYFPWLWAAAVRETPESREAALVEWAQTLRDHALASLSEAEHSLPMRSGRHYRAFVEGRRTFFRLLTNKNHFPFLKEEHNERSVAE